MTGNFQVENKKLNILIVTQALDDSDWLLGFFTKWVSELASVFKEVFVFALKVGKYDLPENVKVIGLKGKNSKGRVKILKRLYCSAAAIQKEKRIDCMFVHMCPVYALALLPVKYLYKIPVVMWYTHGRATLKLRAAHLVCDRVVTASRSSFPLESGKVTVTGHGIDMDMFGLKKYQAGGENVKIFSAGRIVPIKRIEILIEALGILKERGRTGFGCVIAGDSPSKTHCNYLRGIEKKILNYGLAGQVRLIGPVLHKDIALLYKSSDIFVNLSDTDSLDKSVLESMSCGCLTLTSNKAFADVLPDNLKLFYLKKNDPEELAEKIEMLSALTIEQKSAYGPQLRAIVAENHDLNDCIKKIHSVIEDITGHLYEKV